MPALGQYRSELPARFPRLPKGWELLDIDLLQVFDLQFSLRIADTSGSTYSYATGAEPLRLCQGVFDGVGTYADLPDALELSPLLGVPPLDRNGNVTGSFPVNVAYVKPLTYRTQNSLGHVTTTPGFLVLYTSRSDTALGFAQLQPEVPFALSLNAYTITPAGLYLGSLRLQPGWTYEADLNAISLPQFP
jgi:hypothetical protein